MHLHREIPHITILMNKTATAVACQKHADFIVSSYEFQGAIYMFCSQYLRSSSLIFVFSCRKEFELARSCLKQRGLKKIMRENGLTHLVVSHSMF